MNTKKIKYYHEYPLGNFREVEFFVRFFENNKKNASLVLRVDNAHFADYLLEIKQVKVSDINEFFGDTYIFVGNWTMKLCASADYCGFDGYLWEKLEKNFITLMQTHKF